MLFSARFVSFIAGLLLVYLAYLVGKNLYSRKVGLFAAFLIATNYMLIILSSETLTESLGLLFALLIIYLYFKIIDDYKNIYAVLLGLLVGFLYLVRVEGIIFLVLAIVFLVKRIRDLEIKKAITGFLLIFFSFLFIISPYIYFLYQNTGKLTLTGKSSPNLIVSEIVKGKNLGSSTSEEDNTYEKTFSNYDEKTNSIKLPEQYSNISLTGQISKSPIEFLKIFLKGISSEIKVLVRQYDFAFFIIPLIFLFISIFITKKFNVNEKVFVIILIPFLFLIIFPIFHIESRYLAQPYIFLIFLVSLGCFLDEKISLLPIIKIYMRILRIFIAFLLFLFLIIIIYYYKPYYVLEHKLAADYIKNNSAYSHQDTIIMSRKPFVSFYSQSKKSIAVPYTNVENILKFAKKNKVNYIVIDERFLSIRDNYQEMTKLDTYSNEIKLVFEDYSVSPIRIFKLSFNE